jgi:hypothetical protein
MIIHALSFLRTGSREGCCCVTSTHKKDAVYPLLSGLAQALGVEVMKLKVKVESGSIYAITIQIYQWQSKLLTCEHQADARKNCQGPQSDYNLIYDTVLIDPKPCFKVDKWVVRFYLGF